MRRSRSFGRFELDQPQPAWRRIRFGANNEVCGTVPQTAKTKGQTLTVSYGKPRGGFSHGGENRKNQGDRLVNGAASVDFLRDSLESGQAPLKAATARPPLTCAPRVART